ncbi:hypothetical protein HY642_02715 [Candidatus Woesearchaeota archaeon]|nr:hypothetical protein [Candidatus Woesearchaeota archaeon]
MDTIRETETSRQYRVDQTAVGVRVVASYDPENLRQSKAVVFPKGRFDTFGEVFKFFDDNYRGAGNGVPLEIIGVPPEEKRLLWGRWYSSETQNPQRAGDSPIDAPLKQVLHSIDDEQVPTPDFETIRQRLELEA